MVLKKTELLMNGRFFIQKKIIVYMVQNHYALKAYCSAHKGEF